MRIVLRILAAAGGLLVLAAALAVWLLYSPTPPEPSLSARVQAGSLIAGGRQRTWLLYAPARVATSPALVIAFHGSMGTAAQMRRATGYGFDRLADRDGFIVAYPQGYLGHWNDCRKAADYAARRLDIDDLGFVDALVERLVRERNVDPARVYVTGASNGGHFVYRLALERPAAIAGAAVFAANLPTWDNSDCKPLGPPPPMLIVDGTADPLNPYEGGVVTLFGFGSRGTVQSAQASAAHFAHEAGAAGRTTARIPPKAPGDRTWVERSVWRSPGRGEVQLLTVHGGGHVVPQATYRPQRILGRVTSAIDGPAEAWRFFRRQGR